jgi:methionyl-tRNA synthetase
VWFDACIGYVSISANYAADKGLDWHKFLDEWWHNPENVELFQFIGKDNIPFHTVIFPATLLGAGERWTMLYHMSSSEYLNYENGKFSKSEGRGVFGTDAMETGIPADVWRFYIFYNRPEKQDALFTWKDFQEKVNGELIGNLGNLVNRALSFVSRYYDGKIPFVDEGAEREKRMSSEFWTTVGKFEDDIRGKLDKSDLRDAFHALFALCAFANKTFQDGEPWKTRTTNPPAASALIADLCLLLRDLAVMMSPFMPSSAERLAGFFGRTLKADAGASALDWTDVRAPDGIERVTNPAPLFAKLEDDFVETLRARYAGTQGEREKKMETEEKKDAPAAQASAAQTPAAQAPIKSPKQFVDLDLRAARIANIERHPKADKLYIETLDLGGGEERVIVSGLVPFYKEEELLGKHIIVAYNLKPAKLRGVESRGMLLAASCKGADDTEIVEVLDAGDAPLGSRVALDGCPAPDAAGAEITIDDFASVPITVRGGAVMAEGRRLMLDNKPIVTQRVADGGVR